MKQKYLVTLTSVVIWFFLSVSAHSLESKLCKTELPKPSYLIEMGKKAEDAKKEICAAGSVDEMNLAYLRFLDDNLNWFDLYGGFEESKSVIDVIKSHITFANTSVAISLNLNDKIQVEQHSFTPANESTCIEQSGAQHCAQVLEDFVSLYTAIQNLQAEPERRKTLSNLQKLRADWTPFLDQMKGQTWLELMINRNAYKNSTDTFSRPPSSQWIFMHPTVLIENVSAAVDGENTQEALGLEIIGKNWWRQDKWYLPSGGSLLAVYSDRSDIKDTGYGIALHFQSNYTLGITRRGDENGFFVSVDVIKMFQNKKKAFEAYRSAF